MTRARLDALNAQTVKDWAAHGHDWTSTAEHLAAALSFKLSPPVAAE